MKMRMRYAYHMKRFALISLLLSMSCTDVPASIGARAEHHAQHGRSEMSAAIPVLSVDDLKKSQAYFRDVLGFKVSWEDGDPPDFCEVRRGDTLFFLCQ